MTNKSDLWTDRTDAVRIREVALATAAQRSIGGACATKIIRDAAEFEAYLIYGPVIKPKVTKAA